VGAQVTTEHVPVRRVAPAALVGTAAPHSSVKSPAPRPSDAHRLAAQTQQGHSIKAKARRCCCCCTSGA